ncbi:MAG: mechanosensitive ion channel [Flavobacteriales bacterium]|nr:mechanosensitive ion channel [Flavobacteriales bacterium]
MIDRFTEKILQIWDRLLDLVPALVIALAVMVVFVILGKLVYLVMSKLLDRRWKGSLIAGFVAQVFKWLVYLVGVTGAIDILGFGNMLSGLLAGAGIGAVIIGFAFKDIGENFLSGILLAFNRPFKNGDIIEVDSYKGTVRDLTLRMVHLRSAEGKDFFIPTSYLLKNTVINYTRDDILRLEFIVGISPEDDIDRTRKLILDHLVKDDNILDYPGPKVNTKELGEFTVDLQVMFWVDITVNRKTADEELGHTIRSKVITEVKELLDDAGVSMPSQVLEHRMYKDERFRIEQTGTQKDG